MVTCVPSVCPPQIPPHWSPSRSPVILSPGRCTHSNTCSGSPREQGGGGAAGTEEELWGSVHWEAWLTSGLARSCRGLSCGDLAVGHVPVAGVGRGVTLLTGPEPRDNGGCGEGRRGDMGWEGDPRGGTRAQDGFFGETPPSTGTVHTEHFPRRPSWSRPSLSGLGRLPAAPGSQSASPWASSKRTFRCLSQCWSQRRWCASPRVKRLLCRSRPRFLLAW